jgi:cbb3-type cytochrome oxidase subunit 3
MRRNRVDAAATVFFVGAFLAVITIALYYAVDSALGAI